MAQIRNQKVKKKQIESNLFIDFDTKFFWAWTDFQSYLDFMLVVWAIGAAITYLMLPISWFMESIGFLAVFTEAMLGGFFCFYLIIFLILMELIVLFRCPTIPSQFQASLDSRNERLHGDYVDNR
jgi:hypothetical protein